MTLSPCIDQDYEGWFLLVKIFFHYLWAFVQVLNCTRRGARIFFEKTAQSKLCGFPNSKGGFEPPVVYELGLLCYEVNHS